MTINANRGIRGGCQSYSDGGLAEGTNAATIKTTATINFTIDGQWYAKAATDNIAMTACAQQADLTSCLYTVSIDAAGAVTVTKGVEVLSADLAAGTHVLEWPEAPSMEAVIGGIRIDLDGGTFTSGTTDLSGTGVTGTIYDFANLPASVVTA